MSALLCLHVTMNQFIRITMTTVVVVTLLWATVSGQIDLNEETILVQALGRTMTLGMLYNIRTDALIPGMTYWNPDRLAANVSRRNHPSSHVTFQSRDTLEDKLHFLDMDHGTKASFICGLLSVEGSAGYLIDHKITTNVARVTLKYHSESHFEQLTMMHFNRSNIQYPELFDDTEATHVVIAIEYGADAYFIFEKSVTNETDIDEAYGKLDFAVRKLPTLDLQRNGSVDYKHNFQKNVTDTRVTFHGDLHLSLHPSNFDEAVRAYKNISAMMAGPNAPSVPMKAYLYPLKKLDPSRSFARVQEISQAIINDMVDILKDLEEFKAEARGYMSSLPYKRFDIVSTTMDRFLNLIQRYQQQFRRQVAILIPAIRGTGREEGELATVLDEHFASPFSRANIRHWLNQRESESAILKSFIQLLTPITFSRNQGEHMVHTANEEVVSLNLYFPDRMDPFLETLDNYADGNEYSDTVTQPWFYRYSTRQNLLLSIRDILRYHEVNKDSSIVFVYAVLPPMDQAQQWPSAEIKGYRSSGRLFFEEAFIPPGSPRNLQASVDGSQVTLQWEAPEYGADYIDTYQVVVTERGHRLGEENIQETYTVTSDETQVLIIDPESTVPYDVYVYGVCRIGRTASSEILHHSGVDIRIIGGAEICSPRKAYSGRVEVLHNDNWGTVCGPWTDREARVACRAAGYSGGVAGYSSDSTQGSGQIWMSNVRCNGSEENLDLCSFDWATDGACNHTMDAVVDCYGGPPTGNATTPEQCTIDTLQELLTLARSSLDLARSDLDLAREELTAERGARVQEMAALGDRVTSQLGSEREIQVRGLSSLTGTVNSLQRNVTALTNSTNQLSGKLSKYFSVAFHAVLRGTPTIANGDNVKFNDVKLNTGNGYSNLTGVFTVPSGGGGLYYFYVHVLGDIGQFADFNLKKNWDLLCILKADQNHDGSDDNATGTCAATVRLKRGDRVYVERYYATDNTPLSGYSYSSGFTGFLMKPDD